MTSATPRTVGHAAFWSLAGGVTQQAASFAIFVVLARILVPHEFGLAALAAGVMEVLLVMFRAGIPELIIQDKNPSDERLSTAFWLSMLAGLFAAVLLLTAAPRLASWYQLSELEGLCQLLAVVCVLQGSSIVHEALIKRELDYRALTLRLGAASIVGGAVAIGLAVSGAGVYALIAQRLFQALSLAILAWVTCPWRPSFSFSKPEAYKLVAMGPRLSAGFTLGFISSKALEAILAATLGAATLGLFRVASRTIDMISAVVVTPFVNLALPVVARARHQAGEVRQLAQLTSVILYLASPVVLGLAMLADPLVALVFGKQWDGAGQVLAVLSPLILIVGVSSLAEGVLSAFNRPGRILTLNGFQFASTAGSALLAAPFGAMAVAASQLVRSLATALLAIRLVGDLTPLSSLKALVPIVPLTAALAAEGASIFAVQLALPGASVLAGVAAGGGGYLLAIAARPPSELKEFIAKQLGGRHQRKQVR